MTSQDWDSLEASLSRLSTAEKLQIIERLAQSLHAFEPGHDVAFQRRTLQSLRQELSELPIVNPADGVSNRDHDRLLYEGAS